MTRIPTDCASAAAIAAEAACCQVAARQYGAAGEQGVGRQVAAEVPVALSFNGIDHVVLMATPADLADLAAGFALTDGIAERIASPVISHTADGIQVDVALPPARLQAFLARRQQRGTRSYTGCGICGVAGLGALPRAVPLAAAAQAYDDAAARRALAALPALQPLNRRTGATHAAAWADPDGTVLLVREDVGRHNALDKLIGARLQADPGPGFCVITSRCSYEMVQKAAAAGIGLLVAVSAPTALAIDQANLLGVTLVALARSDTRTMYAGAALVLDSPGRAEELS